MFRQKKYIYFFVHTIEVTYRKIVQINYVNVIVGFYFLGVLTNRSSRISCNKSIVPIKIQRTYIYLGGGAKPFKDGVFYFYNFQ